MKSLSKKILELDLSSKDLFKTIDAQRGWDRVLHTSRVLTWKGSMAGCHAACCRCGSRSCGGGAGASEGGGGQERQERGDGKRRG